MDSTNGWLRQAIADLAAISDEGQLADLQFAFRQECNAIGGIPHPLEHRRQANHLSSNAAVKARELARVAVQLFGLPLEQCERIARDVLIRDPWTDVALELIADYRGNTADKVAIGHPKPADQVADSHLNNVADRHIRRRKW